MSTPTDLAAVVAMFIGGLFFAFLTVTMVIVGIFTGSWLPYVSAAIFAALSGVGLYRAFNT